MRPPWARPEPEFLERCAVDCEKCVPACPQSILRIGRGGYPEVDFRVGECTFCGECVSICPTGALFALALDETAPWPLKAEIRDACLARGGIVCRTCGERCEARAIRFRPVPGGAVEVDVDFESCTGCGACFSVCPVNAVEMRNPR